MFNRTVAVALIAVMTCLSIRAEAQSDADEQAQRQNTAAIAKARVQEIATGKRPVVYVKLRDGTQLRGYISQIEDDSFTVTDKATNKTTSVSYGDVLILRGKAPPSTRRKVLIVVGIGVAILAAVVAVLLSRKVGVKV
jgi:hypothetical protein